MYPQKLRLDLFCEIEPWLGARGPSNSILPTSPTNMRVDNIDC